LLVAKFGFTRLEQTLRSSSILRRDVCRILLIIHALGIPRLRFRVVLSIARTRQNQRQQDGQKDDTVHQPKDDNKKDGLEEDADNIGVDGGENEHAEYG
jgi:hypothetical protein